MLFLMLLGAEPLGWGVKQVARLRDGQRCARAASRICALLLLLLCLTCALHEACHEAAVVQQLAVLALRPRCRRWPRQLHGLGPVHSSEEECQRQR
jgi:hypothetical protein